MPRKTKAASAAEEAEILANVSATLQALAAISASPPAQIKAAAAKHSRRYQPPKFRVPISLEKVAQPANPTTLERFRVLAALFFWLQTERPEADFDAKAILFNRPDQRHHWGLLTTFLLGKVYPTLFGGRLVSLGGRPIAEPTPAEKKWLVDGVEAMRATWPKGRERFSVEKACQALKDGKWQPCPTSYAQYKSAHTLALHHGLIIRGRPVHRGKSSK